MKGDELSEFMYETKEGNELDNIIAEACGVILEAFCPKILEENDKAYDAAVNWLWNALLELVAKADDILRPPGD